MVPPSSPLKGVSMCPGRPPAQSPDKPPPVLPLVLLDAGSCSDTYSSRQPPPPQPRNLLGRGHAKSLLKRGKGITPRFRLQRGVRSKAAAGRPASGPLHPATVPPGAQRPCWKRRPQTAPFWTLRTAASPSLWRTVHLSPPEPSQESPSLHSRPGPPLAGVSRYAGPGGPVLKGPSK